MDAFVTLDLTLGLRGAHSHDPLCLSPAETHSVKQITLAHIGKVLTERHLNLAITYLKLAIRGGINVMLLWGFVGLEQ